MKLGSRGYSNQGIKAWLRKEGVEFGEGVDGLVLRLPKGKLHAVKWGDWIIKDKDGIFDSVSSENFGDMWEQEKEED